MTESPVCTYQSYYEYETGSLISNMNYQGNVECGISSSSQYVLEVKLMYLSSQYPLLMKNPLKNYLQLFNSLTITNILTPKISGNYNIDMFVLVNSTTVLKEFYRLSVIISPISFSFTASFSTINQGRNSLLNLGFKVPLDLESSNQNLANYFGTFSKFYIKFPQLVSNTPAWKYNLGYSQLSSFDHVDCWPFVKGLCSRTQVHHHHGQGPFNLHTVFERLCDDHGGELQEACRRGHGFHCPSSFNTPSL